MHGSTFGGGALGCRVALEFLDVMDELQPMIKEHGVYFRRRLEELAMKYDFVVGPRGKGLMLGLELNIPGKWVVPAAQEQGLLMNCTADKILRFLPPYVIERRHIDQAFDALNKVFQAGPPEQG
jgi:acetylornithine/succinyldiaminopimelate/putrescine aminotransferase